MLSRLDPLRRLQPSLRRFSHGGSVVAHPTTPPRQPAFTVHHGAHSDLITPGQSPFVVHAAVAATIRLWFDARSTAYQSY